MRKLVVIVALLIAAMWYFQDTRTEEEKRGQVSVSPNG